MFAKAKAVAGGVAVVGLGWLAVVGPGVAHPQPPAMPQGDTFTCPDVAGINYMRDPDDVHGYYLCVDGSVRHQFRCPQVTVLIMGTPPKCILFPHPPH